MLLKPCAIFYIDIHQNMAIAVKIFKSKVSAKRTSWLLSALQFPLRNCK